MRTLRSLIASAAMLHLACFPLYGYDRRPVEHGSTVFLDSRTGEPVTEVLVVPSVHEFSGLGFMRSHSDVLFGFGSAEVCLAHPFVHRAGAPFRVQQPKSAGILFLLPPGALGRMGGLEGALVVAPGYRSAFFDTWQLLEAYKLELTPADSDAWLAERSELKRLLESDSLEGSDTRRFQPHYWDPPADSNEVDVCFDDREHELVRAFLSRAP